MKHYLFNKNVNIPFCIWNVHTFKCICNTLSMYAYIYYVYL